MLDSLDTLIAFVLIMLVVSLLITIAVQMISSALNLRGQNVARGLRRTLNAILPGFDAMGKAFTDQVLTGPLLSDSSAQWFPKLWRRAAAVRPDEVFDSIHRIAIGRKTVSQEFRANAQNLLVALGFDKEAMVSVANQINGAVQPVQNVATAAGLANVATQLRALTTAQANRAVAEAVATAGTLDQAYKQFQYWFEIGQERAQQWFTMHTRLCTVLFAFVFAFWLQLDTVEIFRLVSTNRVVRDKLVAQATAVTNQAEKILGDGNKVLQQGLDDWRQALTDEKQKQAVASVTVAPIDSRSTLRQKVQKALEAAAIQSPDALLTAFDKAVDSAAETNLDYTAKEYSTVKHSLDKTGFDLFVNDDMGRWGHGWGADFCLHFWGMLFSAALLSLGAPFWYNILKGLTSLRSAVAQNISKEQKGVQKPPSRDETKAKPPPTV